MPIILVVLILALAIIAGLEWRTRRALRLGNDTRRADDGGWIGGIDPGPHGHSHHHSSHHHGASGDGGHGGDAGHGGFDGGHGGFDGGGAGH